MALCKRQCEDCGMQVTVLVEASHECPVLADMVDEMMKLNRDDDISIILRIDGQDIAAQCSALSRASQAMDCELF